MIINEIKQDLRISHNLLDLELQEIIDACVTDMTNSGIKVDVSTLTSLQKNAIKLYVRAWYDFGGKAEQYQKNYESLKVALAIIDEIEVKTDVQ